MTDFKLSFTSDVWTEGEIRDTLTSYMKGEITAKRAAEILGWSRETWEAHMSGLFSMAVTNAAPDLVKIEVVSG